MLLSGGRWGGVGWGGVGWARLVDEKATAAFLDLGVASFEIGFFLQHPLRIQDGAVLRFLPRDGAAAELCPSGGAHGLLQHVLELGLAALLLRNASTDCFKLQKRRSESGVTA